MAHHVVGKKSLKVFDSFLRYCGPLVLVSLSQVGRVCECILY